MSFKEEEFDLKTRNEQLDIDVPEIEVDRNLMPHRPENLGRPVGLPPLKLAELLAQEPDSPDSEEINTGPAVGNEVC